MERLGQTVRRELGRFGPAAGMADLVAAWPGAVGEAIARNAWPARLARDGTLHVATSSSAWAFELAHLEPDVLERLKSTVPDAAPARLRFAVGRIPEPPADLQAVEGSRIEPSATDLDEAERLAGTIENEELREAVARAAGHSLARARTTARSGRL